MSCIEIIDQVLNPFTECLSPEAARKILEIYPDAETQAHVSELATKADAGKLNDKEHELYLEYVEAFDLVAILKSKARSVLA